MDKLILIRSYIMSVENIVSTYDERDLVLN